MYFQLQSVRIWNSQSSSVHVEILWKIWNPQTKLGARASHGFVVGGASTSAIFTPEVGINYPTLSPIIRRQRYLNSHLLPIFPTAADLATPLRKFWFVWTPDMARRQPFGCMWDISWWSRNTTKSGIYQNAFMNVSQTLWQRLRHVFFTSMNYIISM